jgi:tetratricopeptide (TPR) repeat protein
MKKLLIFVLLIPFFWACKGNKESSEFFKRGNFHFKKNELDKAEHFFSEAIKKTPDFADAYNNRGVVYLKVGRMDEALKDFEKAVATDDSFVDAKLNLGRLYSEWEKLPKPKVCLKPSKKNWRNRVISLISMDRILSDKITFRRQNKCSISH